MLYADTDFFIALSHTNDRLHNAAVEIYKRHRGHIFTSVATFVELALVAKRRNSSAEELVRQSLGIININDVNAASILLAAHLIDSENVGVFDAFHAAFCGKEIISSDAVYDRLGISRIKL